MFGDIIEGSKSVWWYNVVKIFDDIDRFKINCLRYLAKELNRLEFCVCGKLKILKVMRVNLSIVEIFKIISNDEENITLT